MSSGDDGVMPACSAEMKLEEAVALSEQETNHAPPRDETETSLSLSSSSGDLVKSSSPANDNGDADTTNTPSVAPQQQQTYYTPSALQRFLQSYSRRMARHPYRHLLGAFTVALALSVVGMVVGDFSVAVDNDGWQSRGTTIADRSTQLKMVNAYNTALFYDQSGTLWNELIDNVQGGWQATEEDRRTRMLVDTTSMRLQSTTTSTMSAMREYVLSAMQRRMQQQNVSSTGDLAGCDLSWYGSEATDNSHLWPMWKADSTDLSLLSSQAIHDMCVAEQNTKKILEDAGQCYGCSDDRCLPPFSIVFFAHMAVDDLGIDLDCQQLQEAWAQVAYQAKRDLDTCVQAIDVNVKNLDTALEESCPFGFYPTQLDEFFGINGQELMQYSSSIFSTIYENDAEALYNLAGDYDRATWSSVVTGAYDTQDEDLIEWYYDELLTRDMVLALGSAAIVGFAIVVHTRSPWLTMWGLLQIILSFPLSYFVYSLIARLEFFPFLNFIGIFVVFALGADDVFVAVDKWKNARLKHRTASVEDVAAVALPDATTAMFLTSITTAIAFFGTAICPVAPLRAFAVFCGLLIVFDYAMCVFLVFPALCLYDKWKEAGSRNCCVSCHCCRKMEAGEEEGFGDEVDIHSDPSRWSLIHRILLKLYEWIHYLRWGLVVAIIAGVVVSIIVATQMGLPESNDVRLMGPNESQFEQNYQWRLNLLSYVLDKQVGSRANVIWGSRPADTGDHWNPASWTQLVLDDKFDPSPEAAQENLLSFCDSFFENDFADKVSEDDECSINSFDTWLQGESIAASPSNAYMTSCNGATSLPMDPESFHPCIIAWSRVAEDDRVLQLDGKVRLLFFYFRSQVRYDSPYDDLDDAWKSIESFIDGRMSEAPNSVNGAYFSSDDFWWYDTNGSMLRTAYGAAAIALGAATVVVLFSTRSFAISLFSLLTIGFILTSVTAILVGVGWNLGFLESICFAILIGVSVDFVIHFGHAYTYLPGNVSRHDRTKYALVSMGPSLLAAAFTTICSAVIMFFCVISFFTKFATILFFTILMATCGSFIIFITLTDLFGPSQPTWLVDMMIAKIRKKCCCRRGVTKDPEDANDVLGVESGGPSASFAEDTAKATPY